MNETYDIAVVGSGFAGSLFAMIARRLGRSVVMLERGKHPRVVIGESSTPLANLLFDDLATRYDLPRLRPLAKWGTWQATYPDIACGLKRGFTFYHHDLARPRLRHPERDEQLLVAASPHDEIGDTHWYRADFDHFLVCEAQRLGVEYVDEIELNGINACNHSLTVSGARHGRSLEFQADFVVDASGPRGFLHRSMGLGERPLPGFPATQGLYSHFSGVGRLEQTISGSEERPPFPIDDAAVHHVFDGGWIWVLRFNNGITSAGVAATDQFAARWKFEANDAAWRRLLEHIPVLQEQFATAKAERPFAHIPRLSFRSAVVAGKNWALLPSAAGFVDPLLSTGFPLTLLGIGRLAEIVEQDWDSSRFEERMQHYAARTDAELLATARLIGSLYANMARFPAFVALSLLYFAVASFSETARRLGKPQLASSFLLHDHPGFGPACERVVTWARKPRTKSESDGLVREIVRTIEPFNVAGLGKPERRNWYPVEADDLVESAPKLGATEEDILQLLQRCGFRVGLKR